MKLHLLGATGSIGLQTLDVVRKDSKHFQVITMTCYKNIEKLSELIEEFQPLYVAVNSKADSEMLQTRFPSLEVGFGEVGLIKAATYQKGSVLVNALVGSVGLAPTVAAIKNGHNVALANKETLVIGGEIIKPLLEKHNVTLLPLDSEHSAIFQCLQGEKKETVKKLIITASGGSFRDYTKPELKDVSVEDALNHPNWTMGAKITIDSATMMNKGFEIIEAHYLFDIPYEQIEPLLHRESIVHSMVEFVDTSIIAHLGLPDMRIPIAYALYYPSRAPFKGESLNLTKIGRLHFEELNFERFPLVRVAIEAGKSKGMMPTTLNAANEAAVALFLDKKIGFLEIEKLIIEALGYFPQDKDITLDKILNRDKIVKEYLFGKYN
jgi:1-deoxy-D-xylulose-5-phosphate reductoisomerase